MLRAVLYYGCTTYCCNSCTGWLGGSVHGVVRGFVAFLCFLSRYTGPALAYFGVLQVGVNSTQHDEMRAREGGIPQASCVGDVMTGCVAAADWSQKEYRHPWASIVTRIYL